MRDNADELEAVHETDSRFARALQTKGNYSAGTMGQVFLRQVVIFVTGQSGITYPGYAVVLLQELGHALGIGTVALHAQVERLEPVIEQERIARTRNGPEITHQLSRHLYDITHLAKALGVNQTMIAVVRLRHARKAVGIGHPVKVTAVNHTSAHGGGVAFHVFGGRVRHDVGPPLKRAAVNGSGKRIVHNQGHAMTVSHTRKAFNIEHMPTRIGYRFAKHTLGVGAEGFFNLLVTGIGINKGTVNTHLLHGHAKQIERTTVNGVGSQDMVAGLTNIEHGKKVGCLAA